jgi:hypothetical protein
MLGETAPGEVDMADEEGREMDLLPVQLLLGPWGGKLTAEDFNA